MNTDASLDARASSLSPRSRRGLWPPLLFALVGLVLSQVSILMPIGCSILSVWAWRRWNGSSGRGQAALAFVGSLITLLPLIALVVLLLAYLFGPYGPSVRVP